MISKKEFTETDLATKFSNFSIRVYKEDLGKETVVLYTKNLNSSTPPYVRVHSECLTGDVFGSLHCDCGDQLHESLYLIEKYGGILIYLRQEGRGIGLFEKMKAYALQAQGYDTFEANTKLGHQPDLRSYSMVKQALDDLGVNEIFLITNNPSKVSEISKYNIKVLRRIPIIIPPNKYNKKYLEAKKQKFQHLPDKKDIHYYYKFPVDSVKQAHEILRFFQSENTDPFLKIGMSVSLEVEKIVKKEKKNLIDQLIAFSEKNNEVEFSLHVSFRETKHILSDLLFIKETFPNLKKIQLNDLEELSLNVFEKACELFSIDLNLSSKNFHIVEDHKIQKMLQKQGSFICVDDSGGKGIQSNASFYKEKIGKLLDLKLNRIVLAGGFGPDDLNVYFDLRRHYKNNFSIDAETKLKTKGAVDTRKVLQYLQQLISFDDPNFEGVNQTRLFFDKNKAVNDEVVYLDGKNFIIKPGVFNPGKFPSSHWFSKNLKNLIKGESDFCEVGCGSGVISCICAFENKNLRICATDISKTASENAQLNINEHELYNRVKVCCGDVLDGVPLHNKFDSIFWALPFGFLDPGEKISTEELQFFDPGYKSIRKFFQEADKYLKPNGRLLLGFSSDLGQPSLLEKLAVQYSYSLKQITEVTLKENTEVRFEILEATKIV